ncbi:MAG: 6-phosphofructokinase 1 [Cellvibrionaceae bacterium]|jgi:6-phosphofructokinase 1
MNRIGVMTSGGDAPGMNAAVRAVVRAALDSGSQAYAIQNGYQGMVDGGNKIVPFGWNDVGGILHRGGTTIGTARCEIFRTREGRLMAAGNLLRNGLSKLVVIGGNGSLTGAILLQTEWSGLVAELVEQGQIMAETAESHPILSIAGIAGSIDNDMTGTDISIGADTALHRITSAIDSITDTAASHQRTFVVEVMGRNCGYLALMAGIATAADWVLIPESPPNLDAWEDKMCEVLRHGREIGKRDSIVVVAEGAQNRHGDPISAHYVRQILEEKLQEDARVTILGHVQRGGSPSTFDRNLGTLLGTDAVEALLEANGAGLSTLIGLVANRIVRVDLKTNIDKSEAIHVALKNQDYTTAMDLRGPGFKEAFSTLRTLVRATPHEHPIDARSMRIGILNAGAPAPGMNTAVRAAVRLGIDRGHTLFGFTNGFRGMIENQGETLDWMSVNGWTASGGSNLGTCRQDIEGRDLYAVARTIEERKLDALIVIGGWSGYEAAQTLNSQRQNFPAFGIPIICIPATIDNNLPGAEISVGADTALNIIVDAVDRIKQSAVASRRVFVVEVMGKRCGYLALMSALATGAERVYLPEEGVGLKDLRKDVDMLISGFRQGKKLGVILRNEKANPTYSTDFISRLFEEEGRDTFEVRRAILGHIQQGGNPTPFDRIYATRFAAKAIIDLEKQHGKNEPVSSCVGMVNGRYQFTPLEDVTRMMDKQNERPKVQWWLDLRRIAKVLAQPNPQFNDSQEQKQ